MSVHHNLEMPNLVSVTGVRPIDDVEYDNPNSDCDFYLWTLKNINT